MNKIKDFFTRSAVGGFSGILMIYGFFYLIIKLFDKTGFFLKNVFWGLFHLAPTYVLGFHPFIDFLVKTPIMAKKGFIVFNWYDQYFYDWLIFSLIISLIFTGICYLVCNSKTSVGNDMQPTWWVFTIILLLINVVGGIIWTPMLNSTIPMFFTWFLYFLFGYLPFYIATLSLCGLTAFGSYNIKKKLLN